MNSETRKILRNHIKSRGIKTVIWADILHIIKKLFSEIKDILGILTTSILFVIISPFLLLYCISIMPIVEIVKLLKLYREVNHE